MYRAGVTINLFQIYETVGMSTDPAGPFTYM